MLNSTLITAIAAFSKTLVFDRLKFIGGELAISGADFSEKNSPYTTETGFFKLNVSIENSF